MDAAFAIPSPGEDDAPYRPRRTQRVLLERPVVLRLPGGGTQEAVLIDLSTRGFQAMCDTPVLIGSFVSMDLPGLGPVRAQVRWQLGQRMGARFVDIVPLHRCDWVDPAAH